MIKESYMLLTSPLETSTFQDNFVAQPLSNQKQTMLVITVLLSNGPDKKESNNGFQDFGVQKGANFTTLQKRAHSKTSIVKMQISEK